MKIHHQWISIAELAESYDPYRDPSGFTFIRGHFEDGEFADVPLFNVRQINGILTLDLCRLVGIKMPSGRDVRTVLFAIEALASRKPRRKADLRSPHVFEENPLAMTVVAFAKQRGEGKYTNRKLLEALTNLAKALGLFPGEADWPRSVDALGSQLSNLVEMLAARGVILARERGVERLWTIRFNEQFFCNNPESVESVDQVSNLSDDSVVPSMDHDTSTPNRGSEFEEEILHFLETQNERSEPALDP